MSVSKSSSLRRAKSYFLCDLNHTLSSEAHSHSPVWSEDQERWNMVTKDSQMAEISLRHPRTIPIFKKFHLDFYDQGQKTFQAACRDGGLNVDVVWQNLEPVLRVNEEMDPWVQKEPRELIDHILSAFHEKHRRDFQVILPLADKVCRVHAAHPELPKGFVDLLSVIGDELESHLQKEEYILFPWILNRPEEPPRGPVHVMMLEHHSHSERIEELRRLTQGFRPPEQACGSWRELYRLLEEFTDDLMDHIHLENNILFPKAVS